VVLVCALDVNLLIIHKRLQFYCPPKTWSQISRVPRCHACVCVCVCVCVCMCACVCVCVCVCVLHHVDDCLSWYSYIGPTSEHISGNTLWSAMYSLHR